MEKPDYAEGGILYELMLENKARNDHFSYSIWDMILFEAAENQENLTFYYNTVMYDCETEADRITSILCAQETTEMRYKFTAPSLCRLHRKRNARLLRGSGIPITLPVATPKKTKNAAWFRRAALITVTSGSS